MVLHKDTFNTPNFVLIVHGFYTNGAKAQLAGSSPLWGWTNIRSKGFINKCLVFIWAFSMTKGDLLSLYVTLSLSKLK